MFPSLVSKISPPGDLRDHLQPDVHVLSLHGNHAVADLTVSHGFPESPVRVLGYVPPNSQSVVPAVKKRVRFSEGVDNPLVVDTSAPLCSLPPAGIEPVLEELDGDRLVHDNRPLSHAVQLGADTHPDDLEDSDLLRDIVEEHAMAGHDDLLAFVSSPCSCCGLPRGSCPAKIKTTLELFDQIANTGLLNRDGARIPLTDSGLVLGAWECALKNYFEYDTIIESIKYDWDVSLLQNPTPTSAFKIEFKLPVVSEVRGERAVGPLPGGARAQPPPPLRTCRGCLTVVLLQ